MKRYYIKNTFLASTFIISQIHTMFRGKQTRVDWYMLIEKTTRIDYAVYFSGIAINFLILAYCLHYPRGISRNITRFILIVTILDVIHLVLFAKQGFGISKIGIALLIYIFYVFFRKNYGDREMGNKYN